ncbi:hypothetical protein BG004_003792 [Podila humilis]|nr:hypothetical protein BG004_003792 [Podila humilis]
MPSSTTHNIVRLVQLCLSISLLSTAAFLLHYRTNAHANFTNEPLASCISGAVAFIYALWALLNHRRQPDKHQWIYLHGLCCVVVCALLIASAVVAIILGRKGIPCEMLQDAHDMDDPGSSAQLQPQGADMTLQQEYPEFHAGQSYAPGQLCENYYDDMDKACAVLGIVAALFWVADFILIFGWCGSKGRYGPHRDCNHRRRGQAGPNDVYDEEAEANNRAAGDSAYGDNGPVEFDPQEDYYDTLDGRKRSLGWIEHRTRDDPRSHVQGPISMSMQANYYSGSDTGTEINNRSSVNNSCDLEQQVTDHQNISAPVAVTVTAGTPVLDLGAAKRHEGIHTPTLISLNPPPRSQWRQQLPDSPTLPHGPVFQCSSNNEPSVNEESCKPGPTRLPSDIADALSPLNMHRPLTHQQHSDCLSFDADSVTTATTPATTPVAAADSSATPAPSAPPAISQVLSEATEANSFAVAPVTSNDVTTPSRFTDFPVGPACYVFDSCNHEYLPSYVNMAVRNEMHQQLRHKPGNVSGSGSGSRASSQPSTPLHGSPSTSRVSTHKILVTGLGLELVSRSDAEIDAASEMEEQETILTGAAESSTSNNNSTGHCKSAAPTKITLPPAAIIAPPLGNLSSYFPTAPGTPVAATSEATAAAEASPLTSIRSSMRTKSSSSISNISKVNYSGTTRTSSSTSGSSSSGSTTTRLQSSPTKKLSVVTGKTGLTTTTTTTAMAIDVCAGSNELGWSTQSISPQISASPRSPYVGDF